MTMALGQGQPTVMKNNKRQSSLVRWFEHGWPLAFMENLLFCSGRPSNSLEEFINWLLVYDSFILQEFLDVIQYSYGVGKTFLCCL